MTLKNKLSNLVAGSSAAALVMLLGVKEAAAQAVTPGGQAGFVIDPLEANVPIVDDTAVRDNLTNVNVWVNSGFTILTGVAMVYFVWQVIKYALAKGPDAKEEARGAMIGGVIALLVIVGIWGIIAFLSSTLGIGVGGTGVRPAI